MKDDDYIRNSADSRVSAIFYDMQQYTSLINGEHSTKQRRPESEFHMIICSLQYRLLELESTQCDLLSECLRLAMLAFLTTTFQFPGVRARYPYLTNRFRKCCRAVKLRNSAEKIALMSWLLVVGAISVFNVDTEDEWMPARWTAIFGDATWEETRSQLKKVMWIDALQDNIGKKAFRKFEEIRLHGDIDIKGQQTLPEHQSGTEAAQSRERWQ